MWQLKSSVSSVASQWLGREFLEFPGSVSLPAFAEGLCVHGDAQAGKLQLHLSLHFLLGQSLEIQPEVRA